jgi:hypothetical protein
LLVACLGALVSGCSQPAAPIAATPVKNQATASGNRVTGVASCASSGCHGKAFNGTQRDWQTAYHVWESEDPHRHAFEVLYTERCIEIVGNLTRLAKTEYSQVLQDRCIGCHATAGGQSSSFELQAGVTCESCHGPSGNWLDEHYLTSWPDRRSTATGFHDTKQLAIRGAICAGCHIGPIVAADGILYDVNHDLIAAGHPRLTFELDAYLTNLPKHWNAAKDAARYPGAFHVNAWAAGQEQAARRLAWQVDVRHSSNGPDDKPLPWPDFANFECFDCHHGIRPPSDARTNVPRQAGQRGLPRPALQPLAQLAAIHADSASEYDKYSVLLSGSWTTPPAADVARREPIQASNVAEPPKVATLDRADLPALAETLAESIHNPATWDEAVQLYLAAEAFQRDWKSPPLQAAADALAGELGPQNFGGLPPTQYDSPADYDPAKLQTALENLAAALKAAAQAQRQISP